MYTCDINVLMSQEELFIKTEFIGIIRFLPINAGSYLWNFCLWHQKCTSDLRATSSSNLPDGQVIYLGVLTSAAKPDPFFWVEPNFGPKIRVESEAYHYIR